MSACTFCSNTTSTPLYDVTDQFNSKFNLQNCQNCGCIFISPLPTPTQLKIAYSIDYYSNNKNKFNFPFIEEIIDKFRSIRARRLIRLIGKQKTVLDIGCGNGNFLNYLQKFGDAEIFGTELEGQSAQRAQNLSKLHLKIGKLEELDFQSDFFDFISLIHVFEHLETPNKTLSIIDKILKPTGYLLIVIPNIDSIQSRIFKSHWLHLDPPRHLFFLKPKDLKKIMFYRGYELVYEKHFFIEQNPFGFIQSILNTISKRRDLLYEYLKGNKKYVAHYSKLFLTLQLTFFILSFPLFIITDILASTIKKGATVEYLFKKL